MEVTDGDRPVYLGGARKQRLLLVALLARADHTVSVDWLMTVLWGDRPPKSARRNLQLYVHRLRRAVGPHTLVGGSGGYAVLTGEDLDASRFRELASLGCAALERGDVLQASQRLRTALDLWRGPAFAEFSDCEEIAEEGARLDQLKLTVHEQRAQAELALGRHTGLLAELTDLTQEHPYRETLRAHLMVALYRSGRRAEALEVFRDTCAFLREQLGVEPGPVLQRIHGQIMAGDERLNVSGESGTVPRELPADVPGFTGRAEALRALDEMLLAESAAGPVVIAGTAGVGKTALAVHWAHRVTDRFPDGQLHVNLRGYAAGAPVRPLDVLATFLRALGLPNEQIPADETEAAARYRSLAADRRMLVVLDNAVSAEQVRPLLPGSRGCAVVVTSRDRLSGLIALDGARRLTLDALPPSEAESLLVRLLGADRVGREPAVATRLARLCGNLPLALRIAAAHLIDQPRRLLADYTDDLSMGDPITALTVEGDEKSAVSAAFHLSYLSLPEATRRLFRWLGLVPLHDFSMASAAVLAGMTEGDTRTALDALAAAHLICQPDRGRFTLHDLLRRYAGNLADENDAEQERAGAVRRLFEWYLRVETAAVELLYPEILRLPDQEKTRDRMPWGNDPVAALDWMDTERQNLMQVLRRAALHGPKSMAWRLADGLRGYHEQRRHMVDWFTSGRAAIAATRAEGDRRAESAASLNLGHAYACLGRYGRGIAWLNRAITLSADSGWQRGEATALNLLGVVLHVVGRSEESESRLTRALELNERLGSRNAQAIALLNLSYTFGEYGRLREGVDHAGQALALFREIQAPASGALALTNLAELQYLLGRFDQATSHLDTALSRHRELGGLYGEAITLIVHAQLHLSSSRVEEARDYAQTALEIGREIGDHHTQAAAHSVLGSIYDVDGDHEHAIGLYETASRIAEEIDARYPLGVALVGMASAHYHRGAHTTSADYARRAMELAGKAQYGILEGQALTLLASASHGQGLSPMALAYGNQALNRHRQTGHLLGQAQAHFLLARVLRDLDQMARAAGHWEDAARIHAEIGIPVPQAQGATEQASDLRLP